MKIELDFETTVCPTEGCHAVLALPSSVMKKIKDSHESIHCPFGHSFYFPSKTDAEILRERLKIKDQIIASQDTEIKKLGRKAKRKK